MSPPMLQTLLWKVVQHRPALALSHVVVVFFLFFFFFVGGGGGGWGGVMVSEEQSIYHEFGLN